MAEFWTSDLRTNYLWPLIVIAAQSVLLLVVLLIIVAYILVVVTMFILINFAVDVLYTLLDPRIRLKGSS